MKNAVFIDTGAFIALSDSGDSLHAEACRLAMEVEKMAPRVTSPFVLMETCLYLQRRVDSGVSRRFWRSLISKEADVELLPIEEMDLERAHQIAERYADQNFSFVDCTSFACMERLRISHAFSFDQDFLVFKPSSGPAFTRIPR